jgi:hypothetical protein
MLERLRSQSSSARQLDGSGQHLQVTAAPITDEPLTLACWFYSNSLTADQCLLGIYNSGAANGSWMLYAAGTVANDPLRAYKKDNSSTSASSSYNNYQTGVWQHAAGTFASNTDRTAYLDGVAATTNTTSVSDPTAVVIGVGARVQSSVTLRLNGAVAHAAIWNVVLTAEEIAALARRRWSPLLVRPQSLVAYYPLSFAFDGDLGPSRYHLTPTGSPTWTAGPQGIVYPRPTWRPAKPAEVAGGFSPWYATDINTLLGA